MMSFTFLVVAALISLARGHDTDSHAGHQVEKFFAPLTYDPPNALVPAVRFDCTFVPVAQNDLPSSKNSPYNLHLGVTWHPENAKQNPSAFTWHPENAKQNPSAFTWHPENANQNPLGVTWHPENAKQNPSAFTWHPENARHPADENGETKE